jgi:hypothetical protein
MLQNISATPARRTLEFGIYRDGDNNLDAIQNAVLGQALRTSQTDSSIQFTVEDTTRQNGRGLHTNDYTIADGQIGDAHVGKGVDMSDETNLAQFVARTLDNAEANGAKQTWVDLVDHGGGDGGGLQVRDGSAMSMPDIAKAISDGVAQHAKDHPEDAGRNVDGVVANQCLMDTMGFADALSHAGVKWLAASPETMLAPGAPSNVAHAIASNVNDPKAMAKSVVSDVMRTKYDAGDFGGFGPAAAFDVLDLDPSKVARAEGAIKHFNDDAASAARNDPSVRRALRADIGSVDGMARFPEATKDMPWLADRPAIAVYDAIGKDSRVGGALRDDAAAAAIAVNDLVLAHRESAAFDAFGGASYADAAGPTIHFPLKNGQVDPWAPQMKETDNAFYRDSDQGKLVGALV